MKRAPIPSDGYGVDAFEWISDLIDIVIAFARGYYWTILLITGLLLLAMYVAAH